MRFLWAALTAFLLAGCSAAPVTNATEQKPVAAPVVDLAPAVTIASTQAVSCKMFADQAAAQDYMDAQKPGWKLLDRDKDGEACECLSGGSQENKPRCVKWRQENGKSN